MAHPLPRKDSKTPSTTAAAYDPNFTKTVLAAMGPKTSPRMRQVMNSLIPHLHDFAREVGLTVDEWMEGRYPKFPGDRWSFD